MKSIDDMVEELLDMELEEKEGKVIFSDEAKELIHAIAEKCNELEVVQRSNDKSDEYAEGLSPEDVYVDMLNKIVNAPTKIHMRMVPRMLIPIISRKLKERDT